MSRRDDLLSKNLGNMRYFTPELVLKLNSSDSETVDEATERWEDAILSYQKHIRKLSREMPLDFRPITKLSLHDWNLVAVCKDGAGAKGGPVLLAVEDNGNLIFLWYLLSQKVSRIDSPEGWPFTADSIEWLYDEVDFNNKEGQKSFVHRILFSDGSTLVVPFSKCSVTQVKPDRAMSHSDLMQIA